MASEAADAAPGDEERPAGSSSGRLGSLLRARRSWAYAALIFLLAAALLTALAPPGDSRHLIPYQFVLVGAPLLVMGAFLSGGAWAVGPTMKAVAGGAAAFLAVGVVVLAVFAAAGGTMRPGDALFALLAWPAPVLAIFVIMVGNLLGGLAGPPPPTPSLVVLAVGAGFGHWQVPWRRTAAHRRGPG